MKPSSKKSSKKNPKRGNTKRNLTLLAIVFIIGFGLQVVLNLVVSNLISSLNDAVIKAEVKGRIGSEVIKNIYKLESKFLQLSIFPGEKLKKDIVKEIREEEKSIISLLGILNKGGLFKEGYDLNSVNIKNSYKIIYYRPEVKNEFIFERIDIVNKIEVINLRQAEIAKQIVLVNRSLNDDPTSISKNIKKLKQNIRSLAPIFKRLKENATNIVYKNNRDYQSLLKQVQESKNNDYFFQILLTILLATIVLWFFRKLSISIQYTTEQAEENEDYTHDILVSQNSIIIVSDGKNILDVSGGFFDYFHQYSSLEDFKSQHKCICEKFLVEEGYIYNFEDINWLEFILATPNKSHLAKMEKDGKVSVFKIEVNKSNKYERAIISLFDITKMQDMNELLEAEKNKAISATRVKGEFLANMSHEIRTPLNAILGFIGLLKEKPLDEEGLHYLHTIDNSGQSLLGIINDILDFSKIESGKFELDPVKFSPHYEFRLIADLFKAKCSEKNLDFVLELDKKLPETLQSDILRVKQVIANLLSNAIKFSKESQQVILKIGFNVHDSKLTCSVTDKGIGLTEDQQSHIFDAFSQAESSTTRKYGGTGLGLSISTKLVEMLGGKLKVTSKIQEGSCFYFTIPVKVVKGSIKLKEEVTTTSFKGHILLVEDNTTNQMLMAAILKKQGVTFDLANDGVEAVEAIKRTDYDLVLMDENMPNLNGIEATKQVRNMGNKFINLPIIALTANAMTGDREKFIAAGMDDYLTKPVNITELRKVFATYLVE